VEQIPPPDAGKARDQAVEIVGVNPHYLSDDDKIEKARAAVGARTQSRKGHVAKKPSRNKENAYEVQSRVLTFWLPNKDHNFSKTR
jgi:hypothetical protein